MERTFYRDARGLIDELNKLYGLLERAAELCEEQRQKILANKDDPSWTEHLADVRSRIIELIPKEEDRTPLDPKA